jgi:hypothetical protein
VGTLSSRLVYFAAAALAFAACSSGSVSSHDAGQDAAAEAASDDAGGDDATTGGPDDSSSGGPGLDQSFFAADGCLLLAAPCGVSANCCSGHCDDGGLCAAPPQHP